MEDDGRKKRDYPKDDEGQPSSAQAASRRTTKQENSNDDKSKKVCPNRETTQKPIDNGRLPDNEKNNNNNKNASSKTSSAIDTPTTAPNTIWDLETALHKVMVEEISAKEYLTTDKSGSNSFVTFRRAHAGDASKLSSLYRKVKGKEAVTTESSGVTVSEDNNDRNPSQGEQHQEEEENPLELWLADGLGDEDTTPPAVLGILAHVSRESTGDDDEDKGDNNDNNNTLGAVALLTLDWQDGKRMLRVPWFHVDSSTLGQEAAQVLKRRLWLRLSTLALMTGCDCLLS